MSECDSAMTQSATCDPTTTGGPPKPKGTIAAMNEEPAAASPAATPDGSEAPADPQP